MPQINSNSKDDFQIVLLLSCFMGHPVSDFRPCGSFGSIYEMMIDLLFIYFLYLGENSEAPDLTVLIGAAAGGILFIIVLIIVLCCLCR